MGGRAHLEFVSLGKRAELCRWRHGSVREAEARTMADQLRQDPDLTDAAILLVKDSGVVEILQMPPELSTISLDPISKSLTVGSSSRGSPTPSKIGTHHDDDCIHESERKDESTMMTIGLAVKATEAETLASAKETISNYFTAFVGKAAKVEAAARQIFIEDPTAERIKQSTLVGGVQYLTSKKDGAFHVSDELNEEMIVSILQNAGFDGIGKRGAKGVTRPAGLGAAASAPATAPEATAPVVAPAPANNKNVAAQKQARA